jgi:hypothetical protein
LTAAHVATDPKPTFPLVALLVTNGEWRGFRVDSRGTSEGGCRATVHFTARKRANLLAVDLARHQRICRIGDAVLSFRIPEDTVYEIVDEAISDVAKPRPDLVFSEGHVRRRISDVPIRDIKGSRFFELSDAAGDGCSGSPLLDKRSQGADAWTLVGVYIGERVTSAGKGLGWLFPALLRVVGTQCVLMPSLIGSRSCSKTARFSKRRNPRRTPEAISPDFRCLLWPRLQ